MQDGARSRAILDLAKAAKKKLRVGKPHGPPRYTKDSANVDSLEGLNLNQREQEALDLNFASLWVTCFGDGWVKAASYMPSGSLQIRSNFCQRA